MSGPATFATRPDVRVVPLDIDTRLVAAIQAAAGPRCHEAASLLQAYYFAAETHRRARTAFGDDAPAADRARRLLLSAKARLRDFLAAQLLGWINDAPDRRLNRDRAPADREIVRPRTAPAVQRS